MRIFILLLLIWAGTQVQGNAQEEQDFVLKTVQDGISLWVGPEVNDDLTLRVSARANATVEKVRAVFDDARAYPNWVHRCKEAYVLSGGTVNAYTYYSRVSMPFPFNDREVVADITQSIDPETGVFTRNIESAPNALPLNKGVQRVRVYQAVWLVEPLGAGEVMLTCTVRTAAGSGLPKWLRHEIMAGGPVKSLKGLIGELAGK